MLLMLVQGGGDAVNAVNVSAKKLMEAGNAVNLSAKRSYTSTHMGWCESCESTSTHMGCCQWML